MSKILFPTNFSQAEKTALELATTVARDRGAKLLIVHVAERMVDGGELYHELVEPTTEELAELLAEVVPADPLVGFEHRLLTGSPAKEIIELSERERDIELIVMATHGRKGISRWVLGSVTEKVIRDARCPVLTVRAAAADLALHDEHSHV